VKKIIPNALTAVNLILGVVAIISAIQGSMYQASWLIIAAMVVDGADGRVARYFNASSEFGKELDSLCDLVSFGVAPALLAYLVCLQTLGMVGVASAAAFATCGALRLARFNVNTLTVKGYFMGLPIPAAGCVVATFVMLNRQVPPYVFLGVFLLIAYLMVSAVHYPDFKGKGEKIYLLSIVAVIGVAGGILFLVPNAWLFVGFFGYVTLGLVNSMVSAFQTR